MDIMDRFPSRWLRPADLLDRQPKVVTITGYNLETMRGANTKDGKKPVLYFDQFGDKGLVMGKTVSGQLKDAIGTGDPRQWVDKRVELFVTQTDSPNGTVDCIRIRKPSTPPPAANGDPNDNIPF